MGKIILASTSPRRQELIRHLGLSHLKFVDPKVEESPLPGLAPGEFAAHWSRKKAEAVAEDFGHEDIIIAADTVVCYDGNIIGKPVDEADAFNMLAMLSGAWHTVYTGITVICGGEIVTETEETSVLMRHMTPAEIEGYVATGEPMDKAGAYGAQELGSLLVERVEGDFFSVVGLPLFRLGRILSDMGINLFGDDK